MSKISLEPNKIIYPAPIVMVSCGEYDKDETNITTIAWTGVLNTEPAMVYIGVRNSRCSYDIIKRTGEFVINIPTRELLLKTDYCGIKSGKDVDKFQKTGLNHKKAKNLNCPIIKECPINIECKTKEIVNLGTHHMFIANIISTSVDKKYVGKNNKISFDGSEFMCYFNREYYLFSESLAKFGCSNE